MVRRLKRIHDAPYPLTLSRHFDRETADSRNVQQESSQ